jgi:Tfp pilus assembly protein PilX
MLTPIPNRRQNGVVLLMVIIVLVALTLGALALTRSVYTANVVAGNLAFQRSATHSAEIGLQIAVKWLEDNKGKVDAACGQALFCGSSVAESGEGGGGSDGKKGYMAHRADDAGKTADWLDYWDSVLKAKSLTVSTQAGNSVQYLIQRMCQQDGDPQQPATGCVVSPTKPVNNESNELKPKEPSPVYYRITVNVDGPRNTRSLVQAMVSL